MKKNQVKRMVWKGLLWIIGTIFLMVLVMSLSAKNAVRLRMAYMGHPIYAIQSNPKYDKSLSGYVGKDMYTVSHKYTWDDNDSGERVSMYSVKAWGIFHMAMPIPDGMYGD